MIGSFMPPIGQARYETFLNARSAAESGMSFSFGSDWPSVLELDLNGFLQMQARITRSDPGNLDSGTLNPDQALTLEQAVRGGIECMGSTSSALNVSVWHILKSSFLTVGATCRMSPVTAALVAHT